MVSYTVPAKKPDPKARMVRVEDPEEIAAIIRADLRAPIGMQYAGSWFAEDHSLRQFRRMPVEFNV